MKILEAKRKAINGLFDDPETCVDITFELNLERDCRDVDWQEDLIEQVTQVIEAFNHN